MLGVYVALLAIFRKLNLPLYKLFVLASVVVCAFARHTAQLDKIFTEFRICHTGK